MGHLGLTRRRVKLVGLAGGLGLVGYVGLLGRMSAGLGGFVGLVGFVELRDSLALVKLALFFRFVRLLLRLVRVEDANYQGLVEGFGISGSFCRVVKIGQQG